VAEMIFKSGDVVRFKEDFLSRMKEGWKGFSGNIALWSGDLVVRSADDLSCTFYYTPGCESYNKTYPDSSYFHISHSHLELVDPHNQKQKQELQKFQSIAKNRKILKEELSHQVSALLRKAVEHGFDVKASWHDEYGERQGVSWPFCIEIDG
jgi:hypothetical protein